MLYWFKIQANKSARVILSPHFTSSEVLDIIHCYWKRYLKLIPDVPSLPTIGGTLMIHLAAMSTGFHQELRARGKSEETTTQLFYEIAWKIYQKMGSFCWWLAGWSNRSSYVKLLRATKLFRAFPFNSPAYRWKDVEVENNVVGFDCLKCSVAEYFQTKGLSRFCVNTWCALDFPLAEIWDARLERTGSIAGGASKCDFRWVTKPKKNI
jgi:ubiquinone biosynthesis protein|tara:strand:+ start:168 stop:794 length:627 start_codon:yes stop_codon:yes gene_type:complete